MKDDFDSRFKIGIVSTQETKNLMAEVYYDDFYICTVLQEKDNFEVHFSADPRTNKTLPDITVDFDELIAALATAKNALIEVRPSNSKL